MCRLFRWKNAALVHHLTTSLTNMFTKTVCRLWVKNCKLYVVTGHSPIKHRSKSYIKCCTVIVGMKVLFAFLVPENLDRMLLKLCELILPRVHFSGLRGGLFLRTSLQRKKIHSNMLCYTQKVVIHWYFKFWVVTFWNLLPKIKCRAALTKVFFDPDFLAFWSVLIQQQTSL